MVERGKRGRRARLRHEQASSYGGSGARRVGAAFWHVAQWWSQPIVYEKAVLWTVLLETIGVAGSWGPLAGKFKPMTGVLFWPRTGTIRLRPW